MSLHYLFILGICVEAITGAIAAGRKKMDFFGVIIIACITGLGGGTVRDTLFNTHPLTWVSHPEYLIYTSICAFFTIIFAHHLTRIMKVFLVLDALGLATFVVIGTQSLLSAGFPSSVAVIGGMLTGICGGMLRDILCNDVPLVLRREIYALVALAGGVLYVTLERYNVSHEVDVIISLSCIFFIRVFAIFFHIEMPKFDYAKSVNKRKNIP